MTIEKYFDLFLEESDNREIYSDFLRNSPDSNVLLKKNITHWVKKEGLEDSVAKDIWNLINNSES